MNRKGARVKTSDVLGGELHKQAKAQAALEGRSLMSLVAEAVRIYLAEKAKGGKAKSA